jgi:hypothetical protein
VLDESVPALVLNVTVLPETPAPAASVTTAVIVTPEPVGETVDAELLTATLVGVVDVEPVQVEALVLVAPPPPLRAPQPLSPPQPAKTRVATNKAIIAANLRMFLT